MSGIKLIVAVAIMNFVSGCISVGEGPYEDEKFMSLLLDGDPASKYEIKVEQFIEDWIRYEESYVGVIGEPINIHIPKMRFSIASFMFIPIHRTDQSRNTRIIFFKDGEVEKTCTYRKLLRYANEKENLVEINI